MANADIFSVPRGVTESQPPSVAFQRSGKCKEPYTHLVNLTRNIEERLTKQVGRAIAQAVSRWLPTAAARV
jgi:hypothetical protein